MNRIGKLLSRACLPYCRECGQRLWFDEDKFKLGYNVHSVCLHCSGKVVKSTNQVVSEEGKRVKQ